MTNTENIETAERSTPQDGEIAATTKWVKTAKLIIDKNRKTDLEKVKGLAASIKVHGNFLPVQAVPRPDGKYDVRDGAHRVAAARRAKVELLKVEVITDEADMDERAAELARIDRQFNTGEHVRTLSAADEAQFTAEALDLGLDVEEVARRFSVDTDRVRAAHTVARSSAARAVLDTHELDIIQAATLEEFADDPDDVARLVAAAATGDAEFWQRVRSIRHRREIAAERAERAAPDIARGITLLDSAVGYREDATTKALKWLYTAAGQHPGPDYITDENAAAFSVAVTRKEEWFLKETGARVYESYIDTHTAADPSREARPGRYHVDDLESCVEWQHTYYCHDFAAAGLTDEAPSADQAADDADAARQEEAARAEREMVRRCNEAARKRTVDRREWLTDTAFAAWKADGLPKAIQKFVSVTLAGERRLISEHKAGEFADLLIGGDLKKVAARIAADKAPVIEAALVFGAIEGRMQPNNDPFYWWHGGRPDKHTEHLEIAAEALRVLRKHAGYKPAPIELVAMSEASTDAVQPES